MGEKNMSITMKDLAYMAGVSRATVDRVLNKRGRVNIETEKRILALAKSVGYRPNLVAQALSSPNKAFHIGCVLAYVNPAFHSLVRNGIEDAIKELTVFGVKSTIESMMTLDVNEQLSHIEEMEKRGIHALIITPINDPKIVEKLQGLIERGIQVISVTAAIEGVNCLASIGCDHERSGRIMANLMHLAVRKPSKIAAFIGYDNMLGHELRVKGLRSAIKEKYPELSIEVIAKTHDDDLQTYIQTQYVLNNHPDADIFFYAGAGVYGGIRAICESSRRDQIMVFAYDLYDEARKYLKEGTLIPAALYQDPYNQGYTAVKILSDYLLYRKSPESNKIFTKTEILVSECL